MFFGCIEEGTIVYDQDYPEAPENIGGSGSGNDRFPGDGAGSAGGTSDGSGDGSTGGFSDGNGSDGAGSTGTLGDGAGKDGGDTSTGSSDGGDTGDGTGDGAGTGDGGGSTDGGTELDAPAVALTSKEQKIVVSWSPVEGATSYNLTWQNADGTEEIINVSAEQIADGADPILFAHAPLVANTPYTYTVTAVAADGTEAVGTPLTESALPLGCTPSTYQPEGLVAYYNFEGDLSDSAGSYDLTATGDSIVYSNGCVNGKTGHFDGDGGYGYNLDFNDENVAEVADGSFTISVWVNADEDMDKWASVFSTTAVHMENGKDDGWGQGFQLNLDGNMRPQLFACKHCGNNQKLTAPNQLKLNTWTHFAITIDNRTANLYVNGENVGTHDSIDTEFNRLKVGLNRYGQQPWKGYIDELMIFCDAMTDADIANIYKNTLPGTPENVVAINSVGDTVVVGWDAVEAVDEYRVYYSTTGTVDANSPYITVTGGTVVNFDNVTVGQDYTYAVAGVSPLGVGELSAPTTITVDGEVEPVYVDTKVSFHYSVDYINTNPSSVYDPAWYNSRNFQVAEPNMASFARLYVTASEKIKEHGMHINQYKTTITIDNVTAVDYKRQIDVVDKNGGWSYFNYYIITMDQHEFNSFAIRTNRMECFGKTFNTIAEYTACNPEWIQNQKDLWNRQGDNNQTKMLNEIIPMKDGYYHIEVKKYRGSQHYNYAEYDGVRNFTIVTQLSEDTNET